MARPPRKPADAYQSALGLLTRREHSRRELSRKLRARGVEPGEADAALEKLEEQQFQSDERFAAMLVRSRIAAGHGPVRIRAELAAQHGIATEEIEAAIAAEVEAEGLDWDEQAAAQLQRRYGGRPAPDPAERHKRAAFLLRRGFPADVARRIVAADDGEAADLD